MFFLSDEGRTFAMLIGSARGHCDSKLRHTDPMYALALRLRLALMLLLFELLFIFAAFGLGAVGVVKTIDRPLDEQRLLLRAALFHTTSPGPDLAKRFWKNSRLATERVN